MSSITCVHQFIGIRGCENMSSECVAYHSTFTKITDSDTISKEKKYCVVIFALHTVHETLHYHCPHTCIYLHPSPTAALTDMLKTRMCVYECLQSYNLCDWLPTG